MEIKLAGGFLLAFVFELLCLFFGQANSVADHWGKVILLAILLLAALVAFRLYEDAVLAWHSKFSQICERAPKIFVIKGRLKLI